MTHSAKIFAVLTLLFVGGGLLLAGCSQPKTSHTAAAEKPLPSGDELRDRIDRALDYTLTQRHMQQQTTAAWQVVHGVLVFGRDLQIYHDGKLVSAVDYLMSGGALNGWNLRKGDHGVKSILEAGSKTGMGHPDQWLGYLSQCGLTVDEPLIVGGSEYKVADLLTQAQWDIYPGMEATWTLMATSTYVPAGATWHSRDGEEWSVERIVDMESDADVNGAACGGSHRLYGLAVALNHHLEEGGKLEGPWLKADTKLKEAIAHAREFQQPDGSFSTNFFARASHSDDMALRLGATGHVFEFLTVALDDKQFAEPWMTRALVSLLDMLELTKDIDLECGGLYHSAHGLQLYRQRRFGSPERPAGAMTADVGAAPATDVPAAVPAPVQ